MALSKIQRRVLEEALRHLEEGPIAIVGITETCERLRAFDGPAALHDAEEYVGTLPDAASGRYYIDYPCGRDLLAVVPAEEHIALLEKCRGWDGHEVFVHSWITPLIRGVLRNDDGELDSRQLADYL